ncbi:hypothetical protein SDC9_124878 [bioreactor metagenome]|uniref:Uncharacterized protein n=1 Tax=bioreactor metagenome TaxID=1076179 RepID=A0A645CLI1_9ZZZZ
MLGQLFIGQPLTRTQGTFDNPTPNGAINQILCRLGAHRPGLFRNGHACSFLRGAFCRSASDISHTIISHEWQGVNRSGPELFTLRKQRLHNLFIFLRYTFNHQEKPFLTPPSLQKTVPSAGERLARFFLSLKNVIQIAKEPKNCYAVRRAIQISCSWEREDWSYAGASD